MRTKRAVTLASFAGCLVLAIWLVGLGLSGGGEEPIAPGSHGGAQGAAPALNPEAGPQSSHEGGPSGLFGIVVWLGAAGASSGTLVALVAFRGEVKKEKAILRARKQRDQYHRDLRTYNAQLRGAPKSNN